MKKTEIILWVVFAISILMKMFHIPGHGILMVLSSTILSLLYTYFGFALFNNIRFRNIFKKKSYKNISTRNITIAIISGIIFGLAMLGVLFKFQSYPGTAALLNPGAIGIILIFITGIIFYFILNKKEIFFKKLLIRTLLVGSISLFLFFVPDKNWYQWKYKEFPDYYEAILESKKHPDSLEIQNKLEEERLKMIDEMYPDYSE